MGGLIAVFGGANTASRTVVPHSAGALRVAAFANNTARLW
jgi:hypothetical protein